MTFSFSDLLDASDISDKNGGPYARKLRAAQMLTKGQNLNNGTWAGGLAHALQQGLMGYMQGADDKQRTEAEAAISQAFGMPEQPKQPGLIQKAKNWWDGKQPEEAMPSASFQPRSTAQALEALQNADPGNFYLQQQVNKLQMGHLADQMSREEQQKLYDREDMIRREGFQREDARFASEQQMAQQELGLQRQRYESEQDYNNRMLAMKEAEMRGAGGAQGPGSGYGATSIEGDHYRIATSLAAKIRQGMPLTPQETFEYQVALAKISEPTPVPLGNGEVHFEPSNIDMSMFPQPGQPAAPQGGQDMIGVDKGLFPGQVQAESSGNPNAVSSAGATGMAQIMLPTAMDPGYGVPDIFTLAQQMGRSVPDRSEATARRLLLDPELNMTFGGLYQQAMLRESGGNPAEALARYNGGPGRVDNAIASLGQGQFMRGLPAETQDYARKLTPQAGMPQPAPQPQPAQMAAPTPPPAPPQAAQQPGSRIITSPSKQAEAERTKQMHDVQRSVYADTLARIDARMGKDADPNTEGHQYGAPEFQTGLIGAVGKHLPWTDTSHQQGDYDTLTEQVVARIRQSTPGIFTDEDARRAAKELGVLSVNDPAPRQREILENYRRFLIGGQPEGRKPLEVSPEARQRYDNAKTKSRVDTQDPGKVTKPYPKTKPYEDDPDFDGIMKKYGY